jgi:phosphohistidine phosphatase SixA
MRHADRDKAASPNECDQPLTEVGHQKCLAMARRVHDRLPPDEPINVVLSSPWLHARETAASVCSALGLHCSIQTSDLIASDLPVRPVLDLLRATPTSGTILIVGHLPQLGRIAEALTSEEVYLPRAAVCCLTSTPSVARAALAWRLVPDPQTLEEPMKVDLKLVSGLFFFLMDFLAFLTGLWLLTSGLGLLGRGSGQGRISVVIESVGQIAGIDGRLAVILLGFVLVLVSVGYARKAYQEAKAFEHGLRDTVRHFSPL